MLPRFEFKFQNEVHSTQCLIFRLSEHLSKQYAIRKIACFKGVNVYPDVFKYIVMIEFLMDENQSDLYARDIMQRHRIKTMTGYTALYTDFHTSDIDKALEEAELM